MRKFAMIFLIFLLTVTLLGGVASFASAEEEHHDVKVELKKTERDGKLYVTASMTENDGINGLYLRVEFDTSSLTLVNRTFGKAGEALDPIDQFDDPVDPSVFDYPYTATFASIADVKNRDVTGALFTLEFDLKEGAADGEYEVSLYVCEVWYLSSSNTSVKNPKYQSSDLYREGGVKASAVTYEVKGEKVITEESKKNKSVIVGVAVGGSAAIVIALAVAYVVYKKKRK
ncbi:MAG: hypothetical protein J6Y74_05080 [Clostridia bacterium]|nr:hypothetical protein [Clostridia bacterium]